MESVVEGEMSPISKAPAGVSELSMQMAAEVVAEQMAKEVADSQAPTDSLRELADRLLQVYRDQAAQWDPSGGRVMEHMRELFLYAVDSHYSL